MSDGGNSGSGTSDKRKLFVGLVLTSVTLDSEIVNVGFHFDFFIKNVCTVLLQAINSTLHKNDILSEFACVAVRALTQIIKLLAKFYDQRVHQSTV